MELKQHRSECLLGQPLYYQEQADAGRSVTTYKQEGEGDEEEDKLWRSKVAHQQTSGEHRREEEEGEKKAASIERPSRPESNERDTC